jgi:hypothetical protein
MRTVNGKPVTELKVEIHATTIGQADAVIKRIKEIESECNLDCTLIEVKLMDLYASNQSIPEETLAWMKSVGIFEIGKPMEFQSIHSDMIYSRDYLANTPLETLIEKEVKNRDLSQGKEKTFNL